MDPMNVDSLPTSSGLKRQASDLIPSSSNSSFSGKRAKKILTIDELKHFNENMNRTAKFDKWPLFLKDANSDDELLRVNGFIMMGLLEGLRSTPLAITSALHTRDHAHAILTSFNAEEKELWDAGVVAGIDQNEWTGLLEHPKLQTLTSAVTKVSGLTFNQDKATQLSWGLEYRGHAAEALWEHIRTYFNPEITYEAYALFCWMVNSSGMGKSRAIDQLGKTHFVIPINLREIGSTGYPPADHQVRDFLTQDSTEAEAQDRTGRFFDALFQRTNEIINGYEGQGITAVASQFRADMTAGQTMTEPNAFRKKFYDDVIQMAQNLRVPLRGTSHSRSKDDRTLYDYPPSNSCHNLVETLKSRDVAKEMSRSKAKDEPYIIVAFDEAHTLTNRKGAGKTPSSNFTALGHVLRALSHFSFFTLFLSTTGKMSDQPTLKAVDPSARIVQHTLLPIPPFTELGFDTLAQPVSLQLSDGEQVSDDEQISDDEQVHDEKQVLDGQQVSDGEQVFPKNLDDFIEDSHVVNLGRPLFGSRYQAGESGIKRSIVLFAMEKLLNAAPDIETFNDDQRLACLSHRFPIEFNTTTDLSQENKQVEGHMRVCLTIDAAFQSMKTLSSSEPLLSEAAYAIMARKSFDTLGSFKSILKGFAVHKGDRGEYLVLLLLTLARDLAVGPPDDFGRPLLGRRYFRLAPFLYGHLFSKLAKSPSASALQMIQQDFPDAVMHFSHFIKLHDCESVEKINLMFLMTRGAGVLCANNQNIVNVFLRSGMEITLENLGLVISTVKNSSKYTQNSDPEVFKLMDPFELGILKEGKDKAVPLIRVFYALASKHPSLHVTRHEKSPDYDAVVYDIWCAGLSPEFLNPIGDNTETWNSILQASYDWQQTYTSGTKEVEELRRAMNPGAANDDSHWSQWADPKDWVE